MGAVAQSGNQSTPVPASRSPTPTDDTLSADGLRPPEGDQLEEAQLQARVQAKLFGTEVRATRIGRYRILERLGSGGMGVVFRAHDDELDRPIAIKVLHQRSDNARSQARLLREAQALAKLAHPNVVTIYEVGEHEGRVFLAMEFIQGKTLRAFAADCDDPRAVIDAYLQAARGLGAAHRKGLVHRDFKPDNALIDDAEGRVRVLDFGLARSHGDDSLDGASPDSSRGEGALDGRLTETGALMGTPAYMSPEQHLGKSADARSDQFSWAVSLWEALYGQRPFEGSSLAEISIAVTEDRRRASSSRRDVPRGLVRVLDRALARDPEARYSDFRELLADAAKAVAPPRGPRVAVVSVGAAALVVGLFGAVALSRSPVPKAMVEPPTSTAVGVPGLCDPDRDIVEGVLDDETLAKWKARYVPEQHETWMQASWDLFERSAIRERAKFRELRDAACEEIASSTDAAAVRLEMQRLACLEDRIEGTRFLHQAIAAKPPKIAMAEYQPPVRVAAQCENDQFVARLPPVPPDPEVRREVRDIQRELMLARVLGERGRHAQRVQVSEELLDRAKNTGDPAIEARARIGLADALLATDRSRAKQERQRAIETAERAGIEPLLFGAYRDRALEAIEARDPSAEELIQQAEAIWERLGRPLQLRDDALLLRVHQARAFDQHERHVELAREVVEDVRELYGADSVIYGQRLGTLLDALWQTGNNEEALEVCRRRTAVLSRIYGADHPVIALSMDNEAHTLLSLGSPRESRQRYEQSVAMLEAVGPGFEPQTGWARFKLGGVKQALGDPSCYEDYLRAEAELVGDGGHQVWDAVRGPSQALVIYAFFRGFDERVESRLAQIEEFEGLLDIKAARVGLLARSGDLEGAERIIDQEKARMGPAPPNLQDFGRAYELIWRSIIAYEANEPSACLRYGRELMAHITDPDTDLGPGLPAMAQSEYRAFAGRCFVLAGKPEQAIGVLDTSLRQLEELGGAPHFWHHHPVAEVWLAKALVDTGGDPNRALALAKSAATKYQQLGPGVDRERRLAHALVEQLQPDVVALAAD